MLKTKGTNLKGSLMVESKGCEFESRSGRNGRWGSRCVCVHCCVCALGWVPYLAVCHFISKTLCEILLELKCRSPNFKSETSIIF